MPALAALMAALAGSMFSFLVKYFTAQIAIRLAFAGMVVSAYVVLQAGLELATAGIVVAMPAGLVTAFQFVFPSNIGQCIAAALAADAAITGFRVFVVGLGLR